MRGASWVVLVLGAWLAASPMVLHIGSPLSATDVVSGILAVLIGVWGLASAPRMHVAGWISIAIGLWVLAAPWALGVDVGAAEFASNALCGSVMAIFGIVRSTSGPVRATI